MKYKAIINDIDGYSISAAYVTDRIKKSDQPRYNYSPDYVGGNGLYIANKDREHLGTVLYLYLYIFDLDKKIKIDIRDYVLQENKMKKVSDKLFEYIYEKNVKNKVYVTNDSGHWELYDYSQLEIVRPKKSKKKKQ